MEVTRALVAVSIAIVVGSCGPAALSPGDGGLTCEDESDCPTSAPICTSNGICVECETSAECPIDRPVCSNQSCSTACAGSEVNAMFVSKPSDIIWVVDQSGSMNQEAAHVQTKINEFVSLIAASSIDYRVVMIARSSGANAICVPPPLGGPSCSDNAQFRHVEQFVASTDGPQLALSRYADYSSFLRPNSQKHFVFVTDDNSSLDAAGFTNQVNALAPAGSFDGFKVHGIYAYGSGSSGCTGPFGSGAADGTVYSELVMQTGGARGVICTGNWTQVFNDITAQVVAGSRVSCELDLPDPPAGQTLDPTKVNVRYQPGGVAPGSILPQVAGAGSCGSGGWHYDNNANPTKIVMCPSTCSTIQADAAANVKVELGCSTVIQ